MKKRTYIELKRNTENWYCRFSMCGETEKCYKGFVYNSLSDEAPGGCLKNVPLYVAIKTQLNKLTTALIQGDYYISDYIFQGHDSPFCDEFGDEDNLMIIHHEECPDMEFGVTEYERNRLMRARDVQFNFDDVYSSTDELSASSIFYPDRHSVELSASQPFHSGLTFIEIFTEDPQYIINMINSRRLRVNENVVDEIENSLPLYDKLVNAVSSDIRNREAESEYNEYLKHYEDESSKQNYYVNEGYREAYEGDAETEWNNY